MIHPTAVIHPKAKLDSTVSVGPYAVIDESVTVGPHCEIGPHAYITGITEIGSHNRFHSGCFVGGAPQDLKYKGDPTRLRIGDHNTIREAATVNRSTTPEGITILGSHNLVMSCGHIAHDCEIGNHNVIANGALLAGHVVMGDRCLISGTCLVHQFVRIGTLAMMQGGAGISKDLPPFTVAEGYNHICGLNIIGLRRNGFSPEERLELKKLYRVLFRSGGKMRESIIAAYKEFHTPAAIQVLDFVASTKRGICSDRGGREQEDEGPELE